MIVSIEGLGYSHILAVCPIRTEHSGMITGKDIPGDAIAVVRLEIAERTFVNTISGSRHLGQF